MSNIKGFITKNAVDESFLSDWYQNSVTDDPPVWTDEHIKEVCGDFYLIPKEVAANLPEDTEDTEQEEIKKELQAYKEIASIEELRETVKILSSICKPIREE